MYWGTENMDFQPVGAGLIASAAVGFFSFYMRGRNPTVQFGHFRLWTEDYI